MPVSLLSVSSLSPSAKKNIYEVSFADILRKIDPFPVVNKAKRMREEKLMAFNYDNDPHFYEKHFDTVHFNSDDAKPAYNDVDPNAIEDTNKVQVVPPVFARMYKGLSYHLYSQLVKDETFLRTRIPCCIECYLLYVGPDDPKEFEVNEIIPTKAYTRTNTQVNPVRDHQSHKMKLKYLNTKYYVSKTINKGLEEEDKIIDKKKERQVVSHKDRRTSDQKSMANKILLIRRSPSQNLRSASVSNMTRLKRNKSEPTTKIDISGRILSQSRRRRYSKGHRHCQCIQPTPKTQRRIP